MTDQDDLPPRGTFAHLQRATSSRQAANRAARGQVTKRMTARTNARANERPTQSTIYMIDLPADRQQQRSTFNVFRDQYEALKKLQQAAADAGEKRPEMGHMVQEAIDLYVERRAKQLPNVQLRKGTSASA